MGQSFLYICCFVIALTMPTRVFAARLTEIAYDAIGSDAGHEWVELYNDSTDSLDLTGDYFFDGSYHTLAVPPAKAGQGSLVLAPDDYAILADDAATFLADHPGYPKTVIDTVMSLPNYEVSRTLPINLSLNDKHKQVLAESDYLPSAVDQPGYTLEWRTNDQWHISSQLGGSPGQAADEAPVMHAAGLRLSEILSNPTGSDTDQEWVEIENTGSTSILLSGCSVGDRPTDSGHTNRQTIADGVDLLPNAFYLVHLNGSMLNNTNEVVTLSWPDDQVIDTVTMTEPAKEGWSWARFGDHWQWTDQLTPGASNIPAQVLASPSLSTPHVTPSTSRSSPTGSPKSVEAKASTSVSPKKTTVVSSGLKSPSSLKTLKLSPSGSPTLGGGATASSLPPITEIAGVHTEQRKAQSSWLLIGLGIIATLGLVAGLIYRFKLLLLIPKLKTLWPPNIDR